jgi:hypothetical protein
LLLGFFGVTLLALGSVVGWLVFRSTEKVPEMTLQPTASMVTKPKAAVPEPGLTENQPEAAQPREVLRERGISHVAVQIQASPIQAKIFLDDKPIHNPFNDSLQVDHEVHQLRVQLAGYAEFRRSVQFDRDLDVTVALERVQRDAAVSKRKEKERASPMAVPTELEKAELPAKKVLENDPDYFPPSTPKKTKRALDDVEL